MPNVFGQTTPLSQYIDPRRNALMGAAAGLAGGGVGGMWQGAMAGMPLDRQYAMDAQEKAKEQQSKNATLEWLRSSGYNDLVSAVESGGLDVSTAWGEALKRQQPGYGQENLTANQRDFMFAQENPGFSDFLGQGGGDVPATVREWEYFNNLAPDKQAEYLRMKRSNPYLDVGTGFVQPDPTNPGVAAGPAILKNGSVPTGFQQMADGQIAPMQGSDADRERRVEMVQLQQRADAADQRAEIVTNAIDKAIEQANFATTGPVGSFGRAVGATPMIDLEGTINTIKANIGFNELQQMREMSPTGGALGQVAVQELDMLQSVIASLDPRQGEAQLKANLAVIKNLLERQKAYRRAALEQRLAVGGGQQPAGNNPSASGRVLTYNPATGRLE